MTLQKKDRTLEMTVDDLMSSKRMEIAIDYYPLAPQLLRNLFIELGEASQQAAKSVIISEYNMFGSKKEKKVIAEDGNVEAVKLAGLDQYEMVPYLRGITEFNRYNTWWKVTEGLERDIYMADPLRKLDATGRAQLIQTLRGGN